MLLHTKLSRNLESANAEAKYDKSVKVLLANRAILSWILKTCVKEFSDLTIDEIASCIIDAPEIAEHAIHQDETNIVGQNTEDSSMTEGTVTYDIRFLARVPKQDYFLQLINIQDSLASLGAGFRSASLTYSYRNPCTSSRSVNLSRRCPSL